MPRLPVDLMQSGVRGNLPDVLYTPERATSDAFGGQVGAALQSVGAAGVSLAGTIRQYEQREQKFEAQKGFIQARDDDSMAFEQRQRALTGNAEGFWQTQRAYTQKRMNEFLATLPEHQRKEFAVDAEQLVASRTAQAFRAQYQQADANTRVTLDEEARKAGLQLNQDPAAYDRSLAEAEKLIDASPLTPLEKSQRKATLRNSLAYTAAQAEAQQDPAAVVASGVGGGLRDKIRVKESSGNDAAQNPASSARGRYQFLDGTWNNFAGKAGVPAVTAATKGTAADPRNNGAFQEKVMDQYIAASTAELTAARLPVTDANLYLLHFMGQGGGVRFLRELNKDASATASVVFPVEAAKNRSVFFERNEARSLSEVYARLTKGLNGAGTTPVATSSARAALNADQARAVDESARRALVQQNTVATAASDAALVQQRDAALVAIKEGPNPQATYEEGRRSGLFSSYSDITQAERVLAARTKGDDDLQVGTALMTGGRSAANPFDKTHKDGIEAVQGALTKAMNGDSAAAAAAVFDRTGMVPQSFATSMRGALVSDDPGRVQGALVTASNMLRQNPNALAGVDGKDQIDNAVTEYNRLTTKLGMSSEEATQRILADARTPADPVKSEVLQQFRKASLTQEKIDDRLRGSFGSIFSRPDLAAGQQRAVMASIYSELASEAFQQTRDPEKALARADFQVQQQFGAQNGVLTRYPPAKAGLAQLPGSGSDGYRWINEQAVETVRQQLGVVVDPSQVTLMPVERDGVSTAAAFRGARMTVRSGERAFESVPYQIVVAPKDEKGAFHVLPGAFFPDVQDYVDKANALRRNATGPAMLFDGSGVPYEAPAYAPDLLQTPEQAARRQRAEAERVLVEGQAAARTQQAEAAEAQAAREAAAARMRRRR